MVDAGAQRREQLVKRLVRDYSLRELARGACERHGVPDQAEAVAHCLVVLALKADPPRTNPVTGQKELTYGLDPDARGVAERLAAWADKVAHNLAQWGPTYAAIQDEADRYAIHTLRGMIRTDRGEDLIDEIADHVAAVLGNSPRLEQMTLARVIEDEPAGNEYAFRSPLPQWIATVKRRILGKLVASLEIHGDTLEGGSVPDDAEAAASAAQSAFREMISIVAELSETRKLLSDALEQAERYESTLVAQRPATREAAAALAIIRAHLAYVSDDLLAERRAVPGLLAYIVIAMRTSQQLQSVSILSFRLETIERAVIEALARGMRAALEDEHEPKPALVRATRRAVEGGPVVKSRLTALEGLSSEPAGRREQLAPVAERLDRLPPRVADIAAIAPVLGTTSGVVKEQRKVALKELVAVNELYGRTFRRYSRGRGPRER